MFFKHSTHIFQTIYFYQPFLLEKWLDIMQVREETVLGLL